MKTTPHLFGHTSLQHMLSRILCLGVLSTASLLTSSLSYSYRAYGQTQPVSNSVNNAEITNYAQAVLAMETPRQRAFDEIKRLIGSGEIPRIICNDPQSMQELPRQAQNIAVNYCNHSQKIVENNGLTIDQFNKITMELQSNNELKREIHNTLIRLQNPPKSP